jgi:hypothetical protein
MRSVFGHDSRGPFSDFGGRSPFSDLPTDSVCQISDRQTDTIAVIAVLVGSALSKLTSWQSWRKCHDGTFNKGSSVAALKPVTSCHRFANPAPSYASC